MVKTFVFKLVWDKIALDNLKEALDYLDLQSKQAPKILKNGIFNKIETLQKNPFICEPDKLKNPKNDEFRAFIVFNYRITYQIKLSEKEIWIIRIRHTIREPLGY